MHKKSRLRDFIKIYCFIEFICMRATKAKKSLQTRSASLQDLFCRSRPEKKLELRPQLRIKQISESISDKVRPDSHREDRKSRKSCDPELIEVIHAVRNHHAPLRGWRCRSKSEEAQRREHQDLISDIGRRHNQHGADTVRDDVEHQNAEFGSSECFGSSDILIFLDAEHDASHQARVSRP